MRRRHRLTPETRSILPPHLLRGLQPPRAASCLRGRSGREYKSRRRIQGSRGAAARGRWKVRGIVEEGMPSTRLVPAAWGERGGGALAPAWRPPPHQARRAPAPWTCRRRAALSLKLLMK